MSLLRSSISALFLSTLGSGAEALAASPHTLNVESVVYNGTACPSLDPSSVKASYDPKQARDPG